MKRIHVLGGVLAAAALAGGGVALDAALSGPGTPAAMASAAPAAPLGGAPAPAVPTGIGVATLAPGTALVDGGGRALYLFEADTGTVSTCTGACAQVWPALLAAGGVPGTTGGAQAPLVGTSQRADGTQQVTYNGHPLYYFAGDKAPGDVKGQGIHNFGGGWYIVAPDDNKIDSGDPPAPNRAAPAPSSGYGY